jgi:hypothetical protein
MKFSLSKSNQWTNLPVLVFASREISINLIIHQYFLESHKYKDRLRMNISRQPEFNSLICWVTFSSQSDCNTAAFMKVDHTACEPRQRFVEQRGESVSNSDPGLPDQNSAHVINPLPQSFSGTSRAGGQVEQRSG